MLNDIKDNNVNYTTTESIRQDRERSKREDSNCALNCEDMCCKDYENLRCINHNKCKLEMRCSEHCGNTVRKAQ